MEQPLAYTVAEVADALRVRPQTVYAEIRAGRLAARRVGREYRVHHAVLDEYLRCPAAPRIWYDKKRDAWHVLDTGYKSPAVARGKVAGRGAAERALTRYRAAREDAEDKNQAAPRDLPPPPDTIAAILPAYVADRKAEGVAAFRKLLGDAKTLLEFFADDRPSDLTRLRLRAYVEWRAIPRIDANSVTRSASPATAAREIRTLQAAVNFWASESGGQQVRLWRPTEAPPRERYLTRNEAARLLRATRGGRRGRVVADRYSGRHLRRLILLGLYTGRRRSALCALRWDQIDLKTGFIDFRPAGGRETKKRRGFAVVPPSFLAHLRRWRRDGAETVIHISGQPIADPKKAFAAACQRAGLDDVTPHTLKHTAITWSAMRRVPIDDAAVFYDTSRATLERVYRQHAPEILERVARALGGRG